MGKLRIDHSRNQDHRGGGNGIYAKSTNGGRKGGVRRRLCNREIIVSAFDTITDNVISGSKSKPGNRKDYNQFVSRGVGTHFTIIQNIIEYTNHYNYFLSYTESSMLLMHADQILSWVSSRRWCEKENQWTFYAFTIPTLQLALIP